MLISCIVPIMCPGTPEKRDCWLGINQRSSNTVLIQLLGNLTMPLHRIQRYRSMLIHCVIGKTITTTALQWGSATSVSIHTISGALREKSMTFTCSTNSSSINLFKVETHFPKKFEPQSKTYYLLTLCFCIAKKTSGIVHTIGNIWK